GDGDVAAVPVDHDPVAHVQPEAGAVPDRLRGEERLEDPAAHVGWDARPGVADLDEHALVVDAAGAHGEGAAAAHGVDRVVDDVGPDLVELGRVGRDLRQRPV